MRGLVDFGSYLRLLSLLGLLTIVTGCASMCDSRFDCDYHAFGGMRDRHDRTNGRVGSIFDPAAALPSVVPPQEPLPYVEDQTDADSGKEDEETGEESSEGEDLKDRLLDELDDMNELPDLRGTDISDEGIGSEV